jgi:D-xylose 1-dehydrogenase (NADP+, D-xylono-1,5-lactone-forming)
MMSEKKLKWGVLGAAKIARSLAPAIRESPFAVPHAVASRTVEKAQSFAREYGFEKSYDNYEALLQDPEVDVIYNPLPNSLHCEWTVNALKAGKHVLCEKPLGGDVAQCKKMIATAKKNRRVLMEAFMYRFHPQTAKIKELLVQEAIGPVRVVRAAFGFPLNQEAPNVRLAEELSGGCLMDVGCYCVNAIRLAFGEEPLAVLGHAVRGEKSTVDVTFAGTLIFANGREGIFNSSFQTVLDWGVEIVGTRGRILVPSPWKPSHQLASFRLESNGKAETIEIKDGGGIYHLEVNHFCRAILEDQPLEVPPEDGMRNMAVIDALQKSARTGRLVKVRQV